MKIRKATFQLKWVSRLGPRSSRLIVGKLGTEQIFWWLFVGLKMGFLWHKCTWMIIVCTQWSNLVLVSKNTHFERLCESSTSSEWLLTTISPTRSLAILPMKGDAIQIQGWSYLRWRWRLRGGFEIRVWDGGGSVKANSFWKWRKRKRIVRERIL